MMAPTDPRVERARAVSIETVLAQRGVNLRRSGSERIGPCPRCGGTDRFSINVKEGVWNCRQCKPEGISGDVIGLVEWLDNVDFKAAIDILDGPAIGPAAKGNGAPHAGNGHHSPNGNGHAYHSPEPPDPPDDIDEDLQPRRRAPPGPIVAEYDYLDESGALQFQVTRHDPKDFRQRRPDGRGGWIAGTKDLAMLPYRLPELQEALAEHKPVFIVEGEKDVDNAWGKLGIAATCNPRGAGKWEACGIDGYFDGANVIIIADNDPPSINKKTGDPLKHADGRLRYAGYDHAYDVGRHLDEHATSVRLLDLKEYWKDCPEKGDLSDWIAAGGTAEKLWEIAAKAPAWSPELRTRIITQLPLPIPFNTPFDPPLDGGKIPPRPWIVPGLLHRGHVSLMVAPPGSGKSLLTLQLGMLCAAGATGDPWPTPVWSGWRPRGRHRVLIINSEEDNDEMKRRLFAARQVMDIPEEELGGLMLALNPTDIVVAQADSRTNIVKRTPMADRMEQTIKDQAIDILIVDPFAETFQGDENSNSQLKWCATIWRDIARATNCAIMLIHHTKKFTKDMAGDADAGRGGGSLVGVARVASTLFTMSEKEAKAFSIKPQERNRYIRFDDAKANLTLVSYQARWFEKKSFVLPNATADQPADEVGVLVPWKPPDLMAGLLPEHINKIFDSLERGWLEDDGRPPDPDEIVPYSASTTHKGKRWAGTEIKRYIQCDNARATKIIEHWIDNGVLESYVAKHPLSKGKEENCLKVLARPCTVTESVKM